MSWLPCVHVQRYTAWGVAYVTFCWGLRERRARMYFVRWLAER